MSKKSMKGIEYIDDAFPNRSFFDLLGDMYMDPGFLAPYQPDLADLDDDIGPPVRKNTRLRHSLAQDPFAQDTQNIHKYFEKAVSLIPGLRKARAGS